MTKRVLALITALCLVFSMVPAVFAAETGSGTLDNGMTWVLDESGTLTVSGTGPMIDFEELDDVPWHAYASSITQIVVEPGITTIGDLAFCGYNNVTSVSLPEGITSIGKSGISECSNLTDLTLPEGLESIGEMAFYANDSLTVLELPSSVRNIGNRAFSNCDNLLSMTVPEGVTEIGEHTFSWCESLTEVNLPSTLTAIGTDAFMSCFKLESITIPSSIAAISEGAFCQCTSLTEVEIPEGVTSIGYRAFYYCSGLTTVSLPSTLESIGDEAFVLCSSMTGFQVEENNPVFANADDGTLYSKDFTTLYQVPGVTTSFAIPNTVTNVNYGAFWGCHGLTDVEIPDSVTTIGDWAFSGCDALTEVVIPDSVTEIGQYSFAYCDQLADVTLSENLTIIPYRAFRECLALTRITIPASVTEIDNAAFDGCTKLTEVHFLGDAPVFGEHDVFGSVTATCYYPAGNTTWNDDTMQQYDGNLTWVAEGEAPDPTEPTDPEPTEPSEPDDPDDPYSGICGDDLRWTYNPDTRCLTISGTGRMGYEGDAPWIDFLYDINTLIVEEGVTTISDNAFFQEGTTSGLTSVSLPSTLTFIGRQAFRATLIQELVIPDNVTSIGEYAFSGCIDLVSVTLPSELETLNQGVFSNCKNLTQVIKPHMPWFGRMDENTFGNCTSLSDISWFNWDEIPAQTFQNTGVTDLTFHPQVDTIGNQAFQNCSKLTTITFHDGITYIGMETFRDCENLTTMYFEGDCPEFSLDCFKNVTATCYYPADNDTWTAASMDNSILGGNVTWVAEGEEPEPTDPQPTEPSEPSEPSEPADQPDASGVWGDDLTWEIENATLYISGTGSMKDATSNADYPWADYADTVTSLIVEDGVTTLGSCAFSDFQKLAEVSLPQTLTAIGSECFYNCTALTGIDIPDSVTEISSLAFAYCLKLENVDLPDHLEQLREATFSHCISLKSLELPNSLKLIEGAAFYNAGIVSLVIPESVTTLNSFAFECMHSLETVLIPDSVTFMGENVFEQAEIVTVQCYNLSFAHLYAETYGISYQVLEDKPGTPVYNITVTCNAGGTAAVTPNPSPANRYVVLEMQPNKDYSLDSVYYECVSMPDHELVYEQISDTAIVFFMPASDVELQVYFMASKSPFTDVKEGAFYYEPVLWAVSYGVTSGVSETRFAPNDSCTRAQVVTFLWRAAGEPEPTTTKNPFKDVKSSAYYYKAVLWAVENGITTGISKTSFGPNSPCTRAQVVTFLYRAAGGSGSYYGHNPFSDVKSTDYYYDAVLWAVDYGITTGISDTRFGPGQTCTRGQVVTFLYRFMHG